MARRQQPALVDERRHRRQRAGGPKAQSLQDKLRRRARADSLGPPEAGDGARQDRREGIGQQRVARQRGVRLVQRGEVIARRREEGREAQAEVHGAVGVAVAQRDARGGAEAHEKRAETGDAHRQLVCVVQRVRWRRRHRPLRAIRALRQHERREHFARHLRAHAERAARHREADRQAGHGARHLSSQHDRRGRIVPRREGREAAAEAGREARIRRGKPRDYPRRRSHAQAHDKRAERVREQIVEDDGLEAAVGLHSSRRRRRDADIRGQLAGAVPARHASKRERHDPREVGLHLRGEGHIGRM
eukprot:614676-Prymnesium_polylepis.1